MRVISINVNGIRAAARKGFFEWMKKTRPDVVCMQEIKAQEDQLDDPIFSPKGYYRYLLPAVKKGYSGVAIYTKYEPDNITEGLGWDVADNEGRYLQIDLGKLSIASMYLPSGSSGDIRQDVKFDYLDRLTPIFKSMARKRREYILCGDWNIVHKEIDIKNWKSNQKTSGCLPEEREWLDDVFTKLKFVDAFRVVNQKPHEYTWWSNRGQAWANNVGWRIDYQVITPNLADKVKKVSVYKEERFSDHAPLVIDYSALDF